MFLQTIRNCFLQQYTKSPTRGRNCNNPSLIDLALCNDLVLDVSVLSPLRKKIIIKKNKDKCYCKVKVKAKTKIMETIC